MAITTFAELQTAIANWLVRDDLTAVIPDFIRLFEVRVNRTLRVRQMETIATLSPTGGLAALPADFLEWKYLTYTGTTAVNLEYVTPAVMTQMYPDTPADIPAVFTINANGIQVMPTTSDSLTLGYYASIAALSDSNTSNWLLAAYPDAYLFGSLVEGNAYVMEPDAGALWKQRADEVMSEILRLDSYTRGPASVRSYGPTP